MSFAAATNFHVVSAGSLAPWAPAAEKGRSWRDRALCRGRSDEFFDGRTVDAALVCFCCSVREECLDDAMEHRAVSVFRAGLTTSELVRESARRAKVRKVDDEAAYIVDGVRGVLAALGTRDAIDQAVDV